MGSGTKICHTFEIRDKKFGWKSVIGDEWTYLILRPHFALKETQKWWCSFVTKDYITALNLFTIICFYRWLGWKWVELKKISLFLQVFKLSWKNEKKVYGLLSLLNFFRYLRNCAVAFCAWVKVLSNDFSTKLTWTQQNPMTVPFTFLL